MKFKELLQTAFDDAPEQGTEETSAEKSSKQPLISIQDLPKNKELITKYNNTSGIWLDRKNIFDLFLWPPNTFAIIAKFLDITGKYRLVISGENGFSWGQNEVDEVQCLGHGWNEFLTVSVKSLPTPDRSLLELIYSIFNTSNLNTEIDELAKSPKFMRDLFKLFFATDVSFDGVNSLKYNGLILDSILGKLSAILLLNSNVKTQELSKTKPGYGFVQFKQAVCQSGISLNSLTSNIAYIRPEVEILHLTRKEEKCSRGVLNILILPWPEVIDKSYFKPIVEHPSIKMDEYFGFFEYSHSSIIDANKVIEKVEEVRKETGEVDLIVFPECSMTTSNGRDIYKKIKEHYETINNLSNIPTLILGSFSKGDNNNYGENKLEIFYTSTEGKKSIKHIGEHKNQHKHHRWFLDKSQIFNYKLGSVLAPNKKWWEYSKVSNRELISYYCTKHDYQMSPLICEDLARQDPVAPVLRSLGPNLIVALLLDGPQLSGRWPGRYASILTEDPGSSVLSVTSLGMTLRADGGGFTPSRVVALWSEPGKNIELTVNKNSNAILLSLEKTNEDRWTADGRKLTYKKLNYAGHYSI